MNGYRPSQLLARSLLQRTRCAVKPKRTLALSSWRTATASTAAPTSLRFTRTLSSASASAEKPKGTGPDTSSTGNIFLDYLGTIFLSAIGLIIASLVRSYMGTNDKHRIRDDIEQHAALDPLEMDDLRTANSEMTVAVYRDIVQQVAALFSQQQVVYVDFVDAVRRIMMKMKGNNFTIELGYLMDRIVLGALKEQGSNSEEPQPLLFWLVVLSMALSCPAIERINILYEVLQSNTTEEDVTLEDVRTLVGYLQDTCQLVPDTQVIPIPSRKYPVQKHERGTPNKIVEWDGSDSDPMDVDAFAEILRSKAVCAWGECYSVKRHV